MMVQDNSFRNVKAAVFNLIAFFFLSEFNLIAFDMVYYLSSYQYSHRQS